MYSCRSLHTDGQDFEDYQQQLCTDTGCSLEDLPGAMDDRDELVREGQGNSYLQYDMMIIRIIYIVVLCSYKYRMLSMRDWSYFTVSCLLMWPSNQNLLRWSHKRATDSQKAQFALPLRCASQYIYIYIYRSHWSRLCKV